MDRIMVNINTMPCFSYHFPTILISDGKNTIMYFFDSRCIISSPEEYVIARSLIDYVAQDTWICLQANVDPALTQFLNCVRTGNLQATNITWSGNKPIQMGKYYLSKFTHFCIWGSFTLVCDMVQCWICSHIHLHSYPFLLI